MTPLITRIAPRLALALLPLGMAACEPVYNQPYDSPYGGPYGGYPTSVYSDRIYSDRLYDPYAYPQPVYRADGRVFRTAAERDAYVRGLSVAKQRAEREAELLRQRQQAELAAQQRARRAARVERQQDRSHHADRDYDRARRDRSAAERELRHTEWQDRNPVGTRRNDRADADRRDALLAAQRAQALRAQAGRAAEREQAATTRMRQAAAAQARMDSIALDQARQEARAAQADSRSNDDANVRRMQAYRKPGETDRAFRERVRKAQATAERESIPLETLLNPRSGR